MYGASRYSIFADPIGQTVWELSPWGGRSSQPFARDTLCVDFELLDLAAATGTVDVAHVSDWVETKINAWCKLAEFGHATPLMC